MLFSINRSVRHNNITGNIPNNIGNIDGIFHLFVINFFFFFFFKNFYFKFVE